MSKPWRLRSPADLRVVAPDGARLSPPFPTKARAAEFARLWWGAAVSRAPSGRLELRRGRARASLLLRPEAPPPSARSPFPGLLLGRVVGRDWVLGRGKDDRSVLLVRVDALQNLGEVGSDALDPARLDALLAALRPGPPVRLEVPARGDVRRDSAGGRWVLLGGRAYPLAQLRPLLPAEVATAELSNGAVAAVLLRDGAPLALVSASEASPADLLEGAAEERGVLESLPPDLLLEGD